LSANGLRLWRFTDYTRNSPGTSPRPQPDASTCRARSEVREGRLAEVKVSVLPPTKAILDVPGNRRAAFVSPMSFVARIAPGSSERRAFRIEVNGSEAVLLASPDQLDELRRGLNGIARGEGDYCIGKGDDRLWFWWFPAERPPRQR
jgi:hypothetical protein